MHLLGDAQQEMSRRDKMGAAVDTAELRAFRLDRDPELKRIALGNYEAVLRLRHVPNPPRSQLSNPA